MNTFRSREEIITKLLQQHGGYKPEWIVFMEVLLDIRGLLERLEVAKVEEREPDPIG